MIRSAFFALIAWTCLTGASPAPADQWYRISAPDGAVIGWQHETEAREGTSTRKIRERRLAYSVDGHALVRQFLRREVLRDDAGAVRRHTLEVGRDARHLRAANPDAAGDEAPLSAILALAAGRAAPDLRLVRLSAGAALVERRRGGHFDAAWQLSLGESGAVLAVIEPQAGGGLTFTPAPAPLTDADIAPRAALPHAMIASPYDITRSAREGHMRYALALPGGIGLPLPETGEQRVSSAGEVHTVDICEGCGPGISTMPADLARWTAPAPWLESDAPELYQAAARAARAGGSGEAVMQRLARLARAHLPLVDFAGLASARTAWRRRRGDCTEDAVVLAALARAAGFPARVASGLVYERERYHGTRDAFLPHAWTLAYVDGAWRSYDISAGGFDATHIALAIGDGEPETIGAGWRLAGLLQWQAMAEVRAPTRSEIRTPSHRR